MPRKDGLVEVFHLKATEARSSARVLAPEAFQSTVMTSAPWGLRSVMSDAGEAAVKVPPYAYIFFRNYPVEL